MSNYLLDNQAAAAGARFAAISALFDASTFRHLEALGITRGWRCWEVGAGGPSVASWLAARVGPEGHVLASDVDVSWLAGAPFEVRRHDVGREPPPELAFDLIHARLVLVHVAERDAALRSMVGALRPSGWLLIEDADPALQPLACLDARDPDAALAHKIRRGLRALLSERGVDLAYGRKLPRLLREAGLVDVAADAYFPIAHPACAALEAQTIEMIRERLVAGGHATPEEITRHLANVDHLDLATAPMISAWGRRG